MDSDKCKTTEITHPRISIFVGNLNTDVDESILLEKFSQIGSISCVRLGRDKVTEESLGYGFIDYEDPAAAEAAIRIFNFQTWKGKKIRVNYNQRNPTIRKSSVGIFIRNLEKKVDDRELFEMFSPFGNILRSEVAQDGNGNSKGFGFVHFETEKAANKAIEEVNGTFIRWRKVVVTKCVPRKDRKKDSKLDAKSEIEKFVAANVKTFGQAKKKLQDLIEALQTELQCSICHELFKEPSITECGHVFCEECIAEWKNQDGIVSSCPTCRETLYRFRPEKKIFEMNNFILKAAELLLSGKE
ncbi:polyadenylate-binding protein 1-like 2 [Planococcus citri]|uniref:polyadenylate-binding protein 1-like 2 n=1 Tax=Planococcus citri TaxID=170843 RepID=UPI0031F7B666